MSVEIRFDGAKTQELNCVEEHFADRSEWKVRIPQDLATTWLSAVTKLQVPAIVEGMLVLDGIQYTVEFILGDAVAKYEWTEDGPSGWEELYRLAQSVLEHSRRSS